MFLRAQADIRSRRKCPDKGYEDMYALIVTSYNGKASVTLYFSVLQEVAGVTLDQEVIEF